MRPTVTGLTTPASYTEGGAAIRIAPAATIADDFAMKGGKIVVAGLTAEDRVTLRSIGDWSSATSVYTSADGDPRGVTIMQGFQSIGWVRGGNGTPLIIEFGDQVSSETATLVLRQIEYSNVSDAARAPVLYLSVIDAAGQDVGIAVPGGFVAAPDGANPFAGFDFGTATSPAAVYNPNTGRVDLVVGRGGQESTRTLLNQGNGTYVLNDTYPTSPDSARGTTVTVADLDDDGRSDLIVAHKFGMLDIRYQRDYPNTATVYLSNDSGQFVDPVVAFFDMTGDGRLDLVAGDASGRFAIFAGLSNGQYSAAQAYNPFPDFSTEGQRSVAPTFFDVNGDGLLDAVIATSAGVRYFQNDGRQTVGQATQQVFTEKFGADNPFTALGIASGARLAFTDVNGDFAPDLVVGRADGRIDLYLSTARYGAALAIPVVNVNDAPRVDLNGAAAGSGAALAYVENAGPVRIAPDAVVFDPDETNFAGGRLTVTITANSLAEDRMSVLHQGTGAGQIGVSGTTITYGGVAIATASGLNTQALRFDLLAAADNAAAQALARAITFENTSDAPSTVARTVSFAVVDDAGAASNTATATVTVSPVDDLTTIAATARAPYYLTHRGTFQTIGLGLTIADPDGIANGPLTLVATVISWTRGNMQLRFDSAYGTNVSTGGTWSTSATLTNTITDVATLQAAVRSLQIFDPSIEQDALQKTIKVALMSGTTEVSSTIFDVDNRRYSAAPWLLFDGSTLNSGSRAYTEKSGVVTLVPNTILRDGDTTNFFYGTLSVGITNPQADDRVLIAQVGGITVDGSSVLYNGQAFGTLVRNANSTAFTINFADGTGPAAVQALARAMAFENPSAAMTSGVRTVAIAITDGAGGEYSTSVAVDARAVDDAPTLAGVPSSVALSTFGSVLIAPAMTLADVDGNAGGTIRVSGLMTNDVVTIRHQGTGAGQIGVAGNVVSYGGTAIATFAGGQSTTLTITLNGATSDAAIQALVRNLTFANPSPTAAGSRTLALDVTGATVTVAATVAARPFFDLNPGDGPAQTGVTVTYTENAAPLAFVSGAEVYGRPSPTTLTVQISGNPSADDRLTLSGAAISLTGGTISVPGQAIGTYSGGMGGTPLVVTFSGDVPGSTVTTVLSSLRYANVSDNPSTAPRAIDVTLAYSDGVNLSAQAIVNVVAVDDPTTFNPNPLANGYAQHVYTERAAAILLMPNAVVADPDTAQAVTRIRIERAGGYTADDRITLVSTGDGAGQVRFTADTVYFGGIAVGAVTGSATANWTITFISGSPEAAQAVLRAVAYEHVGYNPSFLTRFTNIFVDMPGRTLDALATINVTGVADPAMIDLDGRDGLGTTGATAAVVEDGAPVRIAPHATFVDPDAPPNGYYGTRLTIAVSENGSAGDRLTIIQGGTAGEVTFAGSTLYLNGQSIATFSGGGGTVPLVITFQTAAPPATVDAVIRAVAYSTVADAPPPSVKVSFTAETFGQTSGTPVAVATIAITPANDAPSLGNLGGDTVTFVEGGATRVPLDLGRDALVIDPDGPGFAAGGSLRVRITDNLVSGQDQLWFNGDYGISNDATHILFNGTRFATFDSVGASRTFVFTANATTAAVQALVRNIAYGNGNATNPVLAPRTVEWTLDDGSGGIATATSTIDVTGRNDAPQFAATGAAATYVEGAGAVQVAGGVTLSDSDNLNFDRGSLTVTVASPVVGDTLSLTAGGGVSLSNGVVSVGGVAIGTATFTQANASLKIDFNAGASAARVIALAEAIAFRSTSDDPTAAIRSIGFTLVDGNGTALGGADTAGFVRTVAVTPVNDAPTGTNATLAMVEGGTHVFGEADFGFQDVDGNRLQGIHIVTLPLTGTLYFGSTPAPQGLFIPRADLGVLSYQPAAGASGAGYASFTFRVQDNGGTADGGQNVAVAANTIRIDVSPVNRAPVVTLPSTQPSYTEGAPAVAIAAGATLADDNAHFRGGSITVVGTGLVAGDVLAVASTGTVGTGLVVLPAIPPGAMPTLVYNGQTIGGISEQAGGRLVLSLTSEHATPAAVQALIQAITFRSTAIDPTDAVRTITVTLKDGGGTDNGGQDTATFTRTVAVTPIDTPPVAVADAVTTTEAAAVTIAVIGNDTDIDGGPKAVAKIAGVDAVVGTAVRLASGATVTLQADGTLRYDPDGRFDWLVSADKARTHAAYVAQAIDSFTYALNGGSSTVVAVTIDGVDGPRDQLRGSGLGTIIGTDDGDTINVATGGLAVQAGAGDDGIFAGAAFTAAHRIDGGAGTMDQLGLQGDYSGRITFDADTIRNIDMLVLLPGSDMRFGAGGTTMSQFDIKTHDGNVAREARLIVQANTLRAGETLTFDGSAETDGSFLIYGGAGTNILTGGAKDDGFYFGRDRWTPGNRIDGGAGAMDQLGLQGDFAGSKAISFGADQLTNIDGIVLLSGADTRFNGGGSSFSYTLTMHDGNVAAGKTMLVQANALRADEVLTLNAGAEGDGRYLVYGGAGRDVVVGGRGNDEIWGGKGADTLSGGGGDDVFRFQTGDSTAAARDTILDFARGDLIDVSRIGFHRFVGTGPLAAGAIRATHDGTVWIVEGDLDGNGEVDFQLQVAGGADFVWAATDFQLAPPPPVLVDGHGFTV